MSPKGVQWFHVDDDGSVGKVQYNNTQFTFTYICNEYSETNEE